MNNLNTDAGIEINLPDCAMGNWRIETFTVTADDAKYSSLRANLKGNFNLYVPEGTYKRLVRKDRYGDVIVMSNTPMEVRTNMSFIKSAHGHVLINGLGLGMVLKAVLEKDTVESVTVVEASSEVIAMVAPHFTHDPRVTIIHADALTYQPPAKKRFQAVWHDIWDYITGDNLKDMKKLHRKYGRRADWQGSWCRFECELQNRGYRV